MTSTTPKKVRVPDLALMKQRGDRIVMLTAYDATMARLLDRAGIDLLLVGDSLGNVIMGLDTTIPVTLDVMIHHTRAVARGANRALVVADMPFLTYQVSPEQATRNATRLFQEGGAAAVKLEGGRAVADTVRKLTAAGLPVMGHLGLTPQHVHRLGGMRQQARSESAAHELILDALALEDAGAFAIVLEAIPDTVAEAVTSQLKIPTIGIGAGSHCDGQVLVSYDVLGLFDTFAPPFAKQYAQLGQVIVRAAKDYANDVREGLFPKFCLLKSKIHRATITDGNLKYEGSLTIAADLMEKCGLIPYERILCSNMANGNRFETYAIPGDPGSGQIVLNGAAAFQGKRGDVLTIMSFAHVPKHKVQHWKPRVIVLGKRNRIVKERGI